MRGQAWRRGQGTVGRPVRQPPPSATLSQGDPLSAVGSRRQFPVYNLLRGPGVSNCITLFEFSLDDFFF